jgi:hypothetical protein
VSEVFIMTWSSPNGGGMQAIQDWQKVVDAARDLVLRGFDVTVALPPEEKKTTMAGKMRRHR